MICSTCNEGRWLAVLHEPRGFYVGLRCACGPYSRRTGFYRLASSAEAKLSGADIENRTPKTKGMG